MGQVPHYLIIGNGRVATHIQHYFSFLSLSYSSWNRSQSHALLDQELIRATHVLLLVSDHAIQPFIETYLKKSSALLIHFSGSLVIDKAFGAHPLMTFSHRLYDLSKYQMIPFVLDDDAPSFEILLPGLPNSHVRLHKSLKPKYHAMCVMSGNFSCLLWQKLFNTLETEFNLPPAIANHFLQQQMQNLITDPQTALTGPLVRGDTITIENNIAALTLDPFQEVYKSFIACYENMKRGG
jgi:predicted short-subunit dehydrogenase-like oxidoreductase (DUF2520 family)